MKRLLTCAVFVAAACAVGCQGMNTASKATPVVTPAVLPSKDTIDSPQNQAVRNRLEENLKELSAEPQRFETVIEVLPVLSGIKIGVEWDILNAAGVTRNTPVTVKVHDVPIRKVLTTVLSGINDRGADLAYIIKDGGITISTRDDLTSPKYQKWVRVNRWRKEIAVLDLLKRKKRWVNSSSPRRGRGSIVWLRRSRRSCR